MPLMDQVKTIKANGDDGIIVALTAYTDGDVVGGLLTFDVGMVSGGGFIRRVRLIDEDSQDEPYTLYLFNAAPTTIADDAAFAAAMTVADLQKLITTVAISSATTLNTFDYWHSAVLEIPFTADVIYGYLVATGGTPDYANVDTLALFLEVSGTD
jgi:hypothetical protein